MIRGEVGGGCGIERFAVTANSQTHYNGSSVYDLQCPLCSAVEHAPFVRTGAMVRCASCSGKYRIKSSHVQRVLTTGPRTLDEVDPLFSGDSVDLEPDEDASPVQINDEGHVVGLSGLTELMQQTDAKQAKQKLQPAAPASPPPAGRVTRSANKPKPTQPPAAAKSKSRSAQDKAPTSDARQRAQHRRRMRKIKTNLMVGGGLIAGCIAVIFIISALQDDNDQTVQQNAANTSNSQPAQNETDSGADTGLVPDTNPDRSPEGSNEPSPSGDNGPVPSPGDPANPQTPTQNPNTELFAENRAYSVNPRPQYRSPIQNDTTAPAEVPAVLIKPETLTHEGWYILTPPRGFADATGDLSDIELSTLERVSVSPLGACVLQGTLTNQGELAAVGGEVHVALLDPAGRVFAETYLPFALIEPGQQSTVYLPIAQRFWDRARDQRTHCTQADLRNSLDLIPGAVLDPIGRGTYAAVRISVRNPRNQWIKDTVLVLTARDDQDKPIARYRVVQNDLFVAPGDWLDMVVHTPLPGPTNDAADHQWTATLHAPIGE